MSSREVTVYLRHDVIVVVKCVYGMLTLRESAALDFSMLFADTAIV